MKKLILLLAMFPLAAAAQQQTTPQVIYTTYVKEDTSTVLAFWFKGSQDTSISYCRKCMYVQSIYSIDGENKLLPKRSILFDKDKKQIEGATILYLRKAD